MDKEDKINKLLEMSAKESVDRSRKRHKFAKESLVAFEQAAFSPDGWFLGTDTANWNKYNEVNKVFSLEKDIPTLSDIVQEALFKNVQKCLIECDNTGSGTFEWNKFYKGCCTVVVQPIDDSEDGINGIAYYLDKYMNKPFVDKWAESIQFKLVISSADGCKSLYEANYSPQSGFGYYDEKFSTVSSMKTKLGSAPSAVAKDSELAISDASPTSYDSFPPTTARYATVNCLDNDAKNYFDLDDVEVFADKLLSILKYNVSYLDVEIITGGTDSGYVFKMCNNLIKGNARKAADMYDNIEEKEDDPALVISIEAIDASSEGIDCIVNQLNDVNNKSVYSEVLNYLLQRTYNESMKRVVLKIENDLGKTIDDYSYDTKKGFKR